MAQFDVHRNTGRRRDAAPYFVVVQSSLFRDHVRRIAVPLVRRDLIRMPDARLNPEFVVEGRPVVLATLEVASLPLEAFGALVGSLAERGDDILAALDLVLSRAWD